MNRSILIVDDEEIIRHGIKARLEYLYSQAMALYEAESAAEAIEIFKEHDVDIIITDIKMREMDGLTLIRKLKSIYPKLQVVILSGYAEFEYAEQAIHLGVNEYLLKPISNDSLKKAVDEVLSKIIKNEKMQKIVQEGERSIAQNEEYFLEQSLNHLLNTQSPSRVAYMNEKISKKLPIDNRGLLVAIINIDSESYIQKYYDYKDIDLIKFSIKNVFMELSSVSDKIIVNNLSNMNQLYVVLSYSNPQQLRVEIEKLLSRLLNFMRKNMKISLTFGISSVAHNISSICNKQAKEALLQRIIHGRSNLYFYDDISLLSDEQVPNSQLHILRKYIERHDANNIECILNEIFSDENIKKYNSSYIRMIWIRIVNIVLEVANNEFTSNPKTIEKLVLTFEHFSTFSSTDDLRKYLYRLILDNIQVKQSEDINGKSKVKIGIKYIQDNFNKNISINEIAEKFLISPNYFSTIFKKETGQTTVNYIKNLRIKKACEQLIYSNKTIVEISKEVGYEDSQYFFRVFKKATTLTPLQYRKKYRKSRDINSRCHSN